MVSLLCIVPVVSLVLPHVSCKLPTLDLSNSNSISPSKADLLSSLETEGLLVFSGLGGQYTAALQQLRENGPECVDSALQVTLEPSLTVSTHKQRSLGKHLTEWTK